MDRQVILLSGMPASGKDTVTAMLCSSHPEFVAFKKHRSVGPSDKIKDTYFNVSLPEFEKMIENGDFIQYHGRYGRYYGIAKSTLADCFNQNRIPIIHIGRIENYYTFCKHIQAFEAECRFSVQTHHILLWETRDELCKRIAQRDKTEDEIARRIAAMQQEFEDNIVLMKSGEKPFSAIIKNEECFATCEYIVSLVQGRQDRGNEGYDRFWSYLRAL